MIPLTRPCLEFDDLSRDLRRIVASGILTNGEYVRGFEHDVAEYVGVSHGIATTSATSALHLVLAAAEVGPGDEVLVSDFTFPATGNAMHSAVRHPCWWTVWPVASRSTSTMLRPSSPNAHARSWWSTPLANRPT